MSRSLNIANKEQVWKNYVKLPNFKAQCTFCKKGVYYIYDVNFRTHVARCHTEIWKYEEEKKLTRWPWMHFKYLDNMYSQCTICDANIQSTTESVENHLSLHSEEKENHTFHSWTWKYWTIREDVVVECNVCNKNVFLGIRWHALVCHTKKIHSDKLINMQGAHDTADFSERVSSLQANTASRFSNIANKKQIWKYYVKLPNFQAQCMFCENKFYYINSSNFRPHIAKFHTEIWKYEEERKLINWPWMHFKCLNNTYSQCIICGANVLSTFESVEDHWSSHSLQQLKNYILRSWVWKYWTIRDEFMVECNICHKNVVLTTRSALISHTRKTHSDKLKNTQETHDTIKSSECVSSLQTGIMSRSQIIANKRLVWKYYVKLSDFQAQCMFCENKYCYVSLAQFQIHIAKLHTEIWKYEEERKLSIWPWMLFKYLNNIYSQCIICHANVLSTTESLENHLNLHSEEKQQNHTFHSWPSKYWTKRDDFVVECNICNKNLSLSVNRNLNYHTKRMHSDKLKNTQETHDTVEFSKRLLSHQANTASRSLNIANKKQVWKYYVKLPNFQAQCIFCDNKFYYINSSNFRTHIAKFHTEIWKYEKERKLTKWPWMHFKYLNNTYSQCIICHAKVLSTFESVEDHWSSHSLQQLKNYILRSWEWKYWTVRDEFMVECDICHKNVFFYISSTMNFHIKETHSNKLKNIQET